MKKHVLAILFTLLSILGIYILQSPYPVHRVQYIVFSYILPPVQWAIFGLSGNENHVFEYENPKNLLELKKNYHLDSLTWNLSNDFEVSVALMHWVRDQFPHGHPHQYPDSQSFNGLKILQTRNDQGFLCGSAAQLLIQAITSVGGYARRVELRFTAHDAHAAVEVWSDHYQKWILLDPDYDIYYTIQNIPQNALELHQRWAKNQIDDINVISRESPHNIYKKPNPEKYPTDILRKVYEKQDFDLWDIMVKQKDPDYKLNARFSAKILNYYSHISFPMRNDWLSRPLPKWHPRANHVQNSLVPDLTTITTYEDFLLKTKDMKKLYRSPKHQPSHTQEPSR